MTNATQFPLNSREWAKWLESRLATVERSVNPTATRVANEIAAALIASGPTPTVAATPDTVVLRDGAGRSQIVTPAVAADIANKGYVDIYGIGASIPTATDLNIYNTTGKWYQTSNTNAAAGTNYPAPYAGLLEVTNGSGTIFQRYTTYGDATIANPTRGTVFLRTYTSGAWTAWKHQGGGDTGELSSGIITAAADWTISTQLGRRIGRMAHLFFSATYTGSTITVPADGNITNVPIGTVVSAFTPSSADAQPLMSAGSGRIGAFYLTNAGVVGLSAVSGGANITASTAFTFGGVVFL